MKKSIVTLLVAALVMSIILSGQMQGALAKSDNGHANTKRVLASSDEKAAEAIDKGCEKVREAKGLKALLCPQQVADALGLSDDIRLQATDSGADSQIGATAVQKSGNTGAGRKVVVLDTGYNYNHVELSSSYLGGHDFVNNDNNPMDDNGHGSHVAGLITADGINSAARGAAPDVGIISGKVLDSAGNGYFSDVVAAIYWAVDGPDGIAGNSDDFKADAINLSMGTSAPYLYKGYCDSEMPEMRDAIEYAVNRGIAVIVAAGNGGSGGVSIPGCISYAFTVGAVNSQDKVASFSGRGKGVDISAPGVNLVSSWLTSYQTLSGTSMSTPIVSASVALVKHDNPWLSALRVEKVLRTTSVDLGKVGRDNSYGYGRVDVQKALS